MTLAVIWLLALRVSAAEEEGAQPLVRKPRLRAVKVSSRAEGVRVAAGTATRLRFDAVLDMGRTRLEEGRERFEPLLVSHGFLLVTPREELGEGERVPLTVVLADGKQLAFTLQACPDEVDVQVSVVTRRRPGEGGNRVERELRGREGASAAPRDGVAL